MGILYTDVSQSRPVRHLRENLGADEVQRLASLMGLVSGFHASLPITLFWASDDPETGEKRTQRRNLATALTIGEMVASRVLTRFEGKHHRLSTGMFMGRIITGALAGAITCHRFNQPIVAGAVRGAVGAGIGALASYTYERILPAFTGIPRPILTAIENGAAFWLGKVAFKRFYDENSAHDAIPSSES